MNYLPVVQWRNWWGRRQRIWQHSQINKLPDPVHCECRSDLPHRLKNESMQQETGRENISIFDFCFSILAIFADFWPIWQARSPHRWSLQVSSLQILSIQFESSVRLADLVHFYDLQAWSPMEFRVSYMNLGTFDALANSGISVKTESCLGLHPDIYSVESTNFTK